MGCYMVLNVRMGGRDLFEWNPSRYRFDFFDKRTQDTVLCSCELACVQSGTSYLSGETLRSVFVLVETYVGCIPTLRNPYASETAGMKSQSRDVNTIDDHDVMLHTKHRRRNVGRCSANARGDCEHRGASQLLCGELTYDGLAPTPETVVRITR